MPASDLRVRPRCHRLLSGGQRPERGSHYRTASGRIPPPVSQPKSVKSEFRAIDVIRNKRDGIELSRAEIEGMVNAYTRGDIPDYQVSAWLMAVVLCGMTRAEPGALTD